MARTIRRASDTTEERAAARYVDHVAELQIGSQTYPSTDEALRELQSTLQNAFRSTPGIFLHFHRMGADGSESVWVSPASEIIMRFDKAHESGGPTILAFEP